MIKRGIRVNAVAPGPFCTALQVTGGQTPENVQKFGEQVPMGRPGQPTEIAPLYMEVRIRAGELRDRAGVRRVRWCGQSLEAVAVTHWLASLLT